MNWFRFGRKEKEDRDAIQNPADFKLLRGIFAGNKWQIDAIQNPGDFKLLRGSFAGNTVSIDTIDIRILYPRGKDDGSLLPSDILAVLIAYSLEKLKGKKQGRIIIGEVKIDRNGNSRKETISQDIRDKNCYIIIILTEDVKQEFNHTTFEKELNEVLYVLEKEEKPEKMFLPIYMCSREKLESKSTTINRILELVTEGAPLINSPALQTTWVENVIVDNYISKL